MRKTTSILFGIFMIPSLALAVPEAGDKVFSLSGSGTSNDDFDNNAISASVEFGYFNTPQLEYLIRQSVSFVEPEDGDSDWNGATRAGVDYHFGNGNMRPLIGATIGGVYGDEVDETFSAGIEIGLKYYAKEKTYITALVDYQFFFDSSDDIENNYDDGAVFYTLGIGYHF